MTVVVVGCASAMLATLLHVLIVRHLPQRLYVPAIAGCAAVAFVVVGLATSAAGASLPALHWLLGGILTLSLIAVYALVFFGIAWDSPTLALINEIADHGDAGMPMSSLDDFIRRHPFVRSRVRAMVASGTLGDDGASLTARRKNLGLLFQIAETYRRLCSHAEVTG